MALVYALRAGESSESAPKNRHFAVGGAFLNLGRPAIGQAVDRSSIGRYVVVKDTDLSSDHVTTGDDPHLLDRLAVVHRHRVVVFLVLVLSVVATAIQRSTSAPQYQ